METKEKIKVFIDFQNGQDRFASASAAANAAARTVRLR